MASNYYASGYDENVHFENTPFMREYRADAAEYQRLYRNLEATGLIATLRYPVVLKFYKEELRRQPSRNIVNRHWALYEKLNWVLQNDPTVSIQERELIEFLMDREIRTISKWELEESRDILMALYGDTWLDDPDNLYGYAPTTQTPWISQSEEEQSSDWNLPGPSTAPQYSMSTAFSTLEPDEEPEDEPLTPREIMDSISRHVALVEGMKEILRRNPHMRDRIHFLLDRERRELQRLSRLIAAIQADEDEEEEVIDVAWMEEFLTRQREVQPSTAAQPPFSTAVAEVEAFLVQLEYEPETKQEARDIMNSHWSKIDKLKETLRTYPNIPAPDREFLLYLMDRGYREIRRMEQLVGQDASFSSEDSFYASDGEGVSWAEFQEWLAAARRIFNAHRQTAQTALVQDVASSSRPLQDQASARFRPLPDHPYARLETMLRNVSGHPTRIPVHRRHLRAPPVITTRKTFKVPKPTKRAIFLAEAKRKKAEAAAKQQARVLPGTRTTRDSRQRSAAQGPTGPLAVKGTESTRLLAKVKQERAERVASPQIPVLPGERTTRESRARPGAREIKGTESTKFLAKARQDAAERAASPQVPVQRSTRESRARPAAREIKGTESTRLLAVAKKKATKAVADLQAIIGRPGPSSARMPGEPPAGAAQVPVVQQPPPSYLGQNRSYDLRLARQKEAAERAAAEEALMARRRSSRRVTRPRSAPQVPAFRPPRQPENRSYDLRLARQREMAARAAAQEAAGRRWSSRRVTGQRPVPPQGPVAPQPPQGPVAPQPPQVPRPTIASTLRAAERQQAPVRTLPTFNYTAPDTRPVNEFVYNRRSRDPAPLWLRRRRRSAAGRASLEKGPRR